MPAVTCPWCGENGVLPDQMMGRKIRCQKCNTSFVAGAPAASQPAPARKSSDDSIEIDGLDPSTWVATSIAIEPRPEATPRPVPSAQAPSTPGPAEPSGTPSREYKVLTTKDRWFEGKFELSRLEDCLNHYARQGWAVRGMSTPHVMGFSGGPREEIVILLER